MSIYDVMVIVWFATISGLMFASVIYCECKTSKIAKLAQPNASQISLYNHCMRRGAIIFWFGLFVMIMGPAALILVTWGVNVITVGVFAILLILSALFYDLFVVR